MDIVQGIKHILKAANSLQVMAKQDPMQWPTKVIDSILDGEGGQKEHQGSLSYILETVQSLSASHDRH